MIGGYPKRRSKKGEEKEKATTGTISVYHEDRGFGFIIPDGGTEADRIFFHASSLRGYRNGPLGYGKCPEKGDRVRFNVDNDGPKGPRATFVAYQNDNWRAQNRRR